MRAPIPRPRLHARGHRGSHRIQVIHRSDAARGAAAKQQPRARLRAEAFVLHQGADGGAHDAAAPELIAESLSVANPQVRAAVFHERAVGVVPGGLRRDIAEDAALREERSPPLAAHPVRAAAHALTAARDVPAKHGALRCVCTSVERDRCAGRGRCSVVSLSYSTKAHLEEDKPGVCAVARAGCKIIGSGRAVVAHSIAINVVQPLDAERGGARSADVGHWAGI